VEVFYKRLVGFEEITAALAVVDGTYDINTVYKEPSKKLFLKLLLSEHSPIREVQYLINFKKIPYYVHVHLVRHHVGVQPMVESQRLLGDTVREKLPQDNEVDCTFNMNLQALMNMARARMCNRVSQKTRYAVGALAISFENSDHPLEKIIGKMMIPNCELYGICKEPKPCRSWDRLYNSGIKWLYDEHKGILDDV
jgi:hypothetical protein